MRARKAAHGGLRRDRELARPNCWLTRRAPALGRAARARASAPAAAPRAGRPCPAQRHALECCGLDSKGVNRAWQNRAATLRMIHSGCTGTAARMRRLAARAKTPEASRSGGRARSRRLRQGAPTSRSAPAWSRRPPCNIQHAARAAAPGGAPHAQPAPRGPRLKVVQLLRDLVARLAREQRLRLQHRRLELLEAEQARDGRKLAEQPLPHAQVLRQEVARAWSGARLVRRCRAGAARWAWARQRRQPRGLPVLGVGAGLCSRATASRRSGPAPVKQHTCVPQERPACGQDTGLQTLAQAGSAATNEQPLRRYEALKAAAGLLAEALCQRGGRRCTPRGGCRSIKPPVASCAVLTPDLRSFTFS